MASLFQQTLADAIAKAYGGDLHQAKRLIRSVDEQCSIAVFNVLDDAVRVIENNDLDSQQVGSRVEALFKPLLKSGAPIPDPVRFRNALQKLDLQPHPNHPLDKGIVEKCKMYAPDGRTRDFLNDIVTVSDAWARNPERRDDPYLKHSYDTAFKYLMQFIGVTKTAVPLSSETSMENPQTLSEWQAYIARLSGSDLLSKARAANQVAFVRILESDDGLQASDIADILRAFAFRLVEDGQEPPGRYEGAYVDYGAIVYAAPLP